MSEKVAALPFLPGNTFKDITKTKYHLSQTLPYKNGYAVPKRPTVGVGGDPIRVNALSDSDLDELSNTTPTLTYGDPAQPAPARFIPAYVTFDKKVLTYDAYFKQTVHESHQEYYRVRYVKLYYYLEDDTMSVVEPAIENSGIPQGKLIKRHKLPKNDHGDSWTWKDINLGMDIAFYGKLFHIYDCDDWTLKYLTSQGIEVNPSEPRPSDPYTESRQQPLKVFATPSDYDELKQFIELDRKVLRFYCMWDDRDTMFGEIRPHVLHYYLVDNTVEVREVHLPNDGRDPFPVLICRQKLPLDRKDLPSNFPLSVLEISQDEVKEWVCPSHLGVGKTITLNGRKFLMYDCDEFTRAYYKDHYNTVQPPPIQVAKPPPQPMEQTLPPYNGFGSLEDSKQSCLSLIPQPPKKDFIKMLENDGKILRYAAILDSNDVLDANRKFIISFYLSDDSMSIFEPPQRNSGIRGGQFLERTRISKPDSTVDNPVFYTPKDLLIGSTVVAFKHHFIITDVDMYVVKYMEATGILSKEDLETLRAKHTNKTI